MTVSRTAAGVPSVPRADARRIDAYLLAVLTVPLVLLLSNHEWLFPFGQPTDSWLNFTYYFEWGRVHDPALYMTYKASRISWILKGALAYRLFPPAVAHYVLHLGMFLAAITAFYLIAKRLFDAPVAFLGTLAFATYSQFHSVISFEWDYETHDAIVNLLLTMLFLLLAARGVRPRWTLFAAGVAGASAIQSPYVLGYVPALIFWYVSLRRGSDVLDARRAAGYTLAGAVAGTLVYCLMSAAAGGPFFYLWPQLEFMVRYATHARYSPGVWGPVGRSIRIIRGLQVPAAMTLAALGALAYVGRRRGSPVHRQGVIACCGSFLLCIGAHVAGYLHGNPLLNDDHMLVLLAAWEFLTATALFGLILGGSARGGSGEIALAGLAYLGCMAPLVFWHDPYPGPDAIATLWDHSIRTLWPHVALDYAKGGLPVAIIAPFLVIAAPLALLATRAAIVRRLAAALLVVVFLSLANIVTASIPLREYARGWASCGYLEDQFKAVLESYRVIGAHDPDYGLYLWYKTGDTVPFPIETCRARSITHLELSDLYRAIWGARYYSSIGPPPVRRHLAAILGSEHHRQELAALGAAEYGGSPPGPQGYLGDPLGTRDFSALPHAKYWLAVTPNPLRVAVLSHDPADGLRAAATLKRLGATVEPLDTVRVHEGVFSFFITFLRVAH